MADPQSKSLGRVFVEGAVFATAWWSTMKLLGMLEEKSTGEQEDLNPFDDDPRSVAAEDE